MTPQDHLQQIRNRLPQPPIIHSSQSPQAYQNQISQVIVRLYSFSVHLLVFIPSVCKIGIRSAEGNMMMISKLSCSHHLP